jgi:eukaryotic-like serine/threonine-protein kinase
VISATRWALVKRLFEGALAVSGAERAAFVREGCGDDEELRQEVMSLLESHEQADGFLADATGSAPAGGSEPAAGSRLGPYRILGLVGRGGMGDVYQAVRDDDHFKKVVALKLVRREIATGPTIERFRAERQILATLEHPGIARLLDGGAAEDGRPFLVMEHVEGVRIDAYVREHALARRALVELFRSVCAAVQYAHQNLVVHRDLKPANILVTPEGAPKLLDFGVAKLLDPVTPGEATATLFGAMTPAYASPEQVRSEAVTTASDVYSLGVVLYELLTGRSPYRLTTGTPLELHHAICDQEPEPPGTGDDLDAIVLKALRKSPQRRYATVEAFSEDLRRHLDGLPVTARRGTVRYLAGKFVRRNRTKVALSSLLVALGTGFVVHTTVQAKRVARERDKAERVTAFLVDLFKVADPGEVRGNTVTAREMLDKGASRIKTELEGQPEVQAALMDAMGRVYSNLALYGQAQPLIEEALATRHRALGYEHSDVAESLDNLGAVLRRQADYAAAEARYREALELRRKMLGDEHADVARSLNGLGQVLAEKGDATGAEAAFRQALALRRKLLGDEHADVAESLNSLAIVLVHRDDWPGAEGAFREALTLNRKLLGPDHPSVARSLMNLANVRQSQGDYDEAARLHREALALTRQALGNDHPGVAVSLMNLAFVLQARGELEAEGLYREGLVVLRNRLGSEHPRVAQCLDNLANAVAQLRGAYAEAEELSRQALDIRRKLLGPGHLHVAHSLHTLGSVLDLRGDHAAAEVLFRDALGLLRTHQGQRHSDVAHALNDLARARLRQGDVAGAETIYREALAMKEELFGRSHLELAPSLTGLAEALGEKGSCAEAEPLARRALVIRRQSLPADHPDIAEAEGVLGACLAAAGRGGEAGPLLQHSLAVFGARFGERNPATLRAAARLARAQPATER